MIEMANKKNKIKEPSIPVSFSIPESLERRIRKLGTIRGSVCSNILTKFTIVPEKATQLPNKPIIALDSSVIYTAELGDGTFHLVIKNETDTVVTLLSAADIANHVLTLVDLLNTHSKSNA